MACDVLARAWRAKASIDPAHLPLEPFDGPLPGAVGGSGPTSAVLVEHVREHVFLLVWETVEKREEVRLVVEDHLSRDRRCRGRLVHGERARSRTLRQGLRGKGTGSGVGGRGRNGSVSSPSHGAPEDTSLGTGVGCKKKLKDLIGKPEKELA